MASVAYALLRLLRDSIETPADWSTLLKFIDDLPEDFHHQPEVQAERAFAVSQAGNVYDAIAQLEAVLKTSGPSVERLGLLGGRYKRPYRDATDEGARQSLLNEAIDHYERAWISISTSITARQSGIKGNQAD